MATIRARKGFKVTNEEMPLFRESMVVKEQDLAEITRAQESMIHTLMKFYLISMMIQTS